MYCLLTDLCEIDHSMKKLTSGKGYHKGPPAMLQWFPASSSEEVDVVTWYALLYSDFAEHYLYLFFLGGLVTTHSCLLYASCYSHEYNCGTSRIWMAD